MDIRLQFANLRQNIQDLKLFIESESFMNEGYQVRSLYAEQLTAMERQSVVLSELINMQDGLTVQM